MYSKGAGLQEIIKAIRQLDKEALLDLFREKIYFVTNKSNEAQAYGTK